MTLNDLERRNSPYFAFLSPNSIALLANYVTVVDDRPIMSAKYSLSVPVFHFSFACTAIAELLVNFMRKLLILFDALETK